MRTIGETLLLLRVEAMLPQRITAEKLNVAQSTYALYESDKREPSIAFLIKVAEHYGVTVDYLVGLDDIRTHDGQLYNDKLGLSERATETLLNNNTERQRFYAEHSFEKPDNETVDGFSDADRNNGAYAVLLNALLENHMIELAASFKDISEMSVYLSKKEHRERAAVSLGCLSYRCIREFIKFLSLYNGDTTMNKRGEPNA